MTADVTKKKRTYADTTITLAPLSVDEALEAMLKTPPPPAGDKPTRKVKPSRPKRKRR